MVILKKSFANILLLVFILVIVINSFSFSFADSEAANRKRVIMIIINRFTLEDLKYMSKLSNLIKNGSIGLMNTRGIHGYKGAESFATINASARVNATYSYSKSFNFTNNIVNLYNRRYGIKPQKYQIINTEINKLLEINKMNSFNAKIGALGDILHSKGLKTAVFGNSDTADTIIRTNCLIAIDSKGFIDYGNIDNITIKDDLYPYGMRTDYKKIIDELKKINNQASLVVIETGDLDRLYFYKENLTDKMYFVHRKRILNGIDDFIGEILNVIDRKTTELIIISPNMGDEKIEIASKLTPLIFWGNDIPKGILSSKTTRREGLVANIDIAPSITRYLGITYNDFLGRNINFIEKDNNLTFIKHLNSQILFTSNIRKQTLRIYIISELILSIFIIFLLLLKVPISKTFFNLIQILLLTIIAMPLVFLVISSYNIKDVWEFIKYLVFVLSFIMLIAILLKPINRLQFIMILTYLTIFIDLITGCRLASTSVIGYDPVIGARYYGLGNEIIAILLFSLFNMNIVKYNENKRYILFLTIFLLMNAYLLVSSNFGANLGGSLTLLFTSLYILVNYRALEVKKDFSSFVKIFTLIILIIIIFIASNILIDNSSTHINSFFEKALHNDLTFIYSTIKRKLEMNVKLFKNSIWVESFRINIVLLILLLLIQKKFLCNNKFVNFGLKYSIFSSIFGLLLNDSGIVIASLIILLSVTTLIYLVFINTYQNFRM